MKTLVIDVETTIRNPVHGSSPFSPENRLVLLGILALEEDGSKSVSIIRYPTTGDVARLLNTPCLMVGHNIAYDLKWLWSAGGLGLDKRYHLDITRVWDTQQAEYLLSGQANMFPSLDHTGPLYGGTVKDNKIREYWDAGVDTADIPPEELEEYLRADLENTLLVFQGQQAILSHPDLSKLAALASIKMDDVVMSAFMEYNGMAFDLAHAETLLFHARAKADATNKLFNAAVAKVLKNWEPSIASPKEVGTLLFGGDYKVVIDEEVGVFKTGPRKGSPKFRKVYEQHSFKGMVDLDTTLTHAKKTDTGAWQVGDEVLTRVRDDKGTSIEASSTISLILSWRALNKEASTYLEGYSKMVTPDGRIHPTINNCATATGRQSCTKPNLQNVSGVEDE